MNFFDEERFAGVQGRSEGDKKGILKEANKKKFLINNI